MRRHRLPCDQPSPPYYLREDRDRRSMRSAVVLAVLAHAVLFVVSFPELAWDVAQAQPREVFVVRSVPYTRPVVPPEAPQPRPRARRVPIPDPNPEAPEPLRLAEPAAPVIDDLPDLAAIDLVATPDPPSPTGPVEYRLEMERPVRIAGEDPAYTEIARRARLEGVVILRAVITRQGFVRDLGIVKPLGLGLDESALAAVQEWRFEPARLDGEPVEVIYRVTVRFRLR